MKLETATCASLALARRVRHCRMCLEVQLSTIASISPLDVCGLTGMSVVERARTEDSLDEATAEL